MPRPDVSENLVHFTKGANEDDAFDTLCSIIEGNAVRGSNNLIRSGDRCVCFTEAPLAALSRGLVNLSDFSRYRPFGVIYSKAYVYEMGGRPVIYQSETEFHSLPEEIGWRHMRYEPILIPPADHITDFTWEREWRVKCNSFEVDPRFVDLVVPTRTWAERLRQAHIDQQELLVYAYSEIMDVDLARQYVEPYPWRVFVLDED